MALIASINGLTRRVYLDAAAAVGGVLTFHPTDDLYFAYRAYRAANEASRPFDAFMEAATLVDKGSGKTTPKFVKLLLGTKVVIPDGIDEVNVIGELLTDDGSRPFDTSLVTGPCIINYQPAEAEVIKVTASGNEYSLAEIAAAVVPALLAAAQITPIHSDVRKTNGTGIVGDGTSGDKFRSALYVG